MLGPHVNNLTGYVLDRVTEWQPEALTLLSPSAASIEAIKSRSPQTIVAGRVYIPEAEMAHRIHTDPGAAALWAANLCLESARRGNPADAWIVVNEILMEQVWMVELLARFDVAFSRRMADRGLRALIGGWSVGWLHNAEDHLRAYIPAIEAAHETGAWLGVHQYGAAPITTPDPAFYALRWQRTIIPMYRRMGVEVPPYLVTETGCDMGVTPVRGGWKSPHGYQGNAEKYVNDLVWLAGEYASDPLCLGGTIYCMGDNGDPKWHDFMIDGECVERLQDVEWPRPGSGIPTPPVDVPPVITPPPAPPASNTELVSWPDWAHVSRASVPPGAHYWKLTRAEYQNEQQSGGRHHIFVQEPHDPKVAMVVEWEGGSARIPLDKPTSEPAGNFPMYGGGRYSVRLVGNGVDLSDSVTGLHLPANHHVCYLLTFALAQAEGEAEPPVEEEPPVNENELIREIITRGDAAQVIRFNRDAALQRRIFQDGMVPNSPEYHFDYEGAAYVGQRAEHLESGAVQYFYCKAGDWANIHTITAPAAETPPAIVPLRKVLEVPYRSQLSDTASWGKGDCGFACLAMEFAYKGLHVTIDELARRGGKPEGFTSANFEELIKAATSYGFRFAHGAKWSVARIKQEIDQGNPVIILLDYTKLPYKYDAQYRMGHFILAVGYEGERIIYHDPYWPTAKGGAFCWIDGFSLEAAWYSNQYQRNWGQVLRRV